MIEYLYFLLARIRPGYARLWIRRNWWRALACAGWMTAAILLRQAVAATRPERWIIGGEIFPCLFLWRQALRAAAGEWHCR